MANKCKRTGRIAKQLRTGIVHCYRREECRSVIVRVGKDGFNQCTSKDCPFSEKPIAQDFD